MHCQCTFNVVFTINSNFLPENITIILLYHNTTGSSPAGVTPRKLEATASKMFQWNNYSRVQIPALMELKFILARIGEYSSKALHYTVWFKSLLHNNTI